MRKFLIATLTVACLGILVQEADAAGRAVRGARVRSGARFRNNFRGGFGGFGIDPGLGLGIGVLPGVPLVQSAFVPQAFGFNGIGGGCGVNGAAFQQQAFAGNAFASPFTGIGVDPFLSFNFGNRFGSRGNFRGRGGFRR